MVKQSIDVAGQYMIGQTADGTAKVAQVDNDGKLVTSGGGGGGGNVTIVGDTVGLAKSNQLPANLRDANLSTSSILYVNNGSVIQPVGGVGDAIKTTSVSDGIQGTGMNPPAGGSGIIGFLSGIFTVVTALLSRTRTSVNTNGSGRITTAGTSQLVLEVATRNYLLIQNISDGDLWVSISFDIAVIDGPGSIKLKPDDKIILDNVTTTNPVYIIGASAGQGYTIISG